MHRILAFVVLAAVAFGSFKARAIIGGAAPSPGDPALLSTLAVYVRPVQGGDVEICSGVLIRPDLALTAAHCLNQNVVASVGFGADATRPEQMHMRPAQKWQLHPEWRPEKFPNFDIAWINLGGAPFPKAAPVPILTDSRVVSRKVATIVAGHGHGGANGGKGPLRSVNSFFRGLVVDGTGFRVGHVAKKDTRLQNTLLLGPNQGHGPCGGDSGGPAYVRVGERWYLAGTAVGSEADGCDTGSAYYAYVGAYASWIQRTALRSLRTGR